LPDSDQPNDDRRTRVVSAAPKADQGLPEQGFVFCSFSNPYKITPMIFDIWVRLLHQVDGVLRLLQRNEAARHNLRPEAEKRGAPAEPLGFRETYGVQKNYLAGAAPRFGYRLR